MIQTNATSTSIFQFFGFQENILNIKVIAEPKYKIALCFLLKKSTIKKLTNMSSNKTIEFSP
ncbi:hypothetical protein CGC49_04315 [Capnocytophaga sp. H4358]|uniref:hypothetical protein n=1 Tax=Capnocytophaga sp. H4358 TaxID=1945658 RepID=UPI000BB1E08C|nr:hypothetical protein [Capnocytophaga sp. H4358]ATA72590.1 hypothetical protein CGC49_04315 [Capnocytophaga sp. H4358]